MPDPNPESAMSEKAADIIDDIWATFHNMAGWHSAVKDDCYDGIELCEKLRAALGWQPIDTIPKDGTSILALWDNDHAKVPVIVYWNGVDKIYPWWTGDTDINVAYPEDSLSAWMPLPKAPQR